LSARAIAEPDDDAWTVSDAGEDADRGSIGADPCIV
jgi:hypothetical protein